MAGEELAHRRPDDHLLDEAAEWIGRLRASDVAVEDRQAFARWLARSPAHRAAFDTMADLFDGLGTLAVSPARTAPAPEVPVRRRTVLALAATFVLGFAGLVALQFERSDVHETALGERREIVLTDGSRLWLNTGSRVEVLLAEDRRVVEIDRGGELFVDVAPDPDRPFLVRSEHGEARALGTRFGVRAEAAFMRVSVTEGSVGVRAREDAGSLAGTATGSRVLGAAEAVDVTANRPVPVAGDFVADALAWREGRLVYDDVALSELVEDLNRYLPDRMTISDAELARTRVSAVLRIADQQTMLRALEEVLPLGWVRVSDGLVVIHSV